MTTYSFKYCELCVYTFTTAIYIVHQVVAHRMSDNNRIADNALSSVSYRLKTTTGIVNKLSHAFLTNIHLTAVQYINVTVKGAWVISLFKSVLLEMLHIFKVQNFCNKTIKCSHDDEILNITCMTSEFSSQILVRC